jgi:hypothetical protein
LHGVPTSFFLGFQNIAKHPWHLNTC